MQLLYHCESVQVDELNVRLAQVMATTNERLGTLEASMDEVLSPESPSAKVCMMCAAMILAY